MDVQNVKREIVNATQTINALPVHQVRLVKRDRMECPVNPDSLENQAETGMPSLRRIPKAAGNALRDLLDLLETRVPLALLDPKDHLDRQPPAAEDEDNQDQQAHQARPEILDQMGHQVRRVHPDGMEQAEKDVLGRKDNKDRLELLDNLEPQELPEMGAESGPADPLDPQGKPGILARLARQVLLDNQGILETMPSIAHALLALLFINFGAKNHFDQS